VTCVATDDEDMADADSVFTCVNASTVLLDAFSMHSPAVFSGSRRVGNNVALFELLPGAAKRCVLTTGSTTRRPLTTASDDVCFDRALVTADDADTCTRAACVPVLSAGELRGAVVSYNGDF